MTFTVLAAVILWTWVHTLFLHSTAGLMRDRPPVYFIQQPLTDVLAHHGRSFYLNCSAASSDGTEVTFVWRKDGVNFLDGVDAENRMTVLPSGSLLIAPVLRRHRRAGRPRGTDEGLYQCVAQHRLGTIVSHPSRLRIASIARKFSSDPKDSVAVAGQSVRFSCSIRAWPEPLIAWYKDGQPVDRTNDRLIVLETLGVLQIIAVVESDEGVYYCVARNEAGEKSSHGATLTVMLAGNDQYIAAKLLAEPLSIISPVAETNVVIECFITGLPQPVVTWTKQGSLGAVNPLVQDHLHTDAAGNLHIEHIASSDSGIYTCTWSDQVTSAASSTRVNVTVLVPPLPFGGHDLLAPVTRKRRGQTIFLRCQFDGHPLPDVIWLKNGSEVSASDPRIHVKNNQNGSSQLSLTSANRADSGMYQCQASNPAGVYLDTTWVVVQPTEIVLRPPVNLVATTLSSSAIRIMWEDDPETNSSDVIAYSIHFYPTLLDVKELQQVVQSRDQTLRNLRPATNYTIYIVTYTNGGISEPSLSITAATSDDDMLLQSQSTAHGMILRSTVTSSGMNSSGHVQQNETRATDFTDQQLGIIIGSCIGLTCIIASILIVCLHNRCCATMPAAVHGHAGGEYIANGSVPSTRTNICHCHVLPPDGHHMMFHPPSPGEEVVPQQLGLPAQLAENQHCDTKGGNVSKCCNGKIKHEVMPTNSIHTGPVLTDDQKVESSSGHSSVPISDPSLKPLLSGCRDGVGILQPAATDDLDGIDYDLSADEEDGQQEIHMEQSSDAEQQSSDRDSVLWKQLNEPTLTEAITDFS